MNSNVYGYGPALETAAKRQVCIRCALPAWDKVTSGSKDSLGDISPELQYLPRKQNSGFLCVSIEHNEMNQE